MTTQKLIGMDWYNNCSAAGRARWHAAADSAVPADAYRAFCEQTAHPITAMTGDYKPQPDELYAPLEDGTVRFRPARAPAHMLAWPPPIRAVAPAAIGQGATQDPIEESKQEMDTAHPPMPAGWTGNDDVDSALIMLSRIDCGADDEARIEAVSAILQKLQAERKTAGAAGWPTLAKNETVALWHAVSWMENVLREWRREGFKDIQDQALRKVNRIRTMQKEVEAH